MPPPTHSPPDHRGVVRSEPVHHLGQRGPHPGTERGVIEHVGAAAGGGQRVTLQRSPVAGGDPLPKKRKS